MNTTAPTTPEHNNISAAVTAPNMDIPATTNGNPTSTNDNEATTKGIPALGALQRLPQEMRDEIYRLCIVNDRIAVRHDQIGVQIIRHAPLAACSRQLYDEVNKEAGRLIYHIPRHEVVAVRDEINNCYIAPPDVLENTVNTWHGVTNVLVEIIVPICEAQPFSDDGSRSQVSLQQERVALAYASYWSLTERPFQWLTDMLSFLDIQRAVVKISVPHEMWWNYQTIDELFGITYQHESVFDRASFGGNQLVNGITTLVPAEVVVIEESQKNIEAYRGPSHQDGAVYLRDKLKEFPVAEVLGQWLPPEKAEFWMGVVNEKES
ncbi:uncharacterized protein LTR77_001957 [Saxophila tyrrhenica]|uniref:Uncharacterized protein n=1 Tax=Saxophila tyrrhenica TaxID=1690608 RepID=A0AAV9PLQ8_9PEZI|nr:hypothetical protein LTR77_001957 [Saxophila tyrrhenica]